MARRLMEWHDRIWLQRVFMMFEKLMFRWCEMLRRDAVLMKGKTKRDFPKRQDVAFVARVPARTRNGGVEAFF